MNIQKTYSNILDAAKKNSKPTIKLILKHFNKYKKVLLSQSKKTIIVSGISIILLIIIFAKPNKEAEETTKTNFYAKVESIQDFANGIQINKPGKIIGNEEIIITSQVMGRVKNIDIREGKEAGQNQKIIEIKDDVANYGIMVQRAKTALNAAKLQYAQAKTQIEQGITNSKLNVEKLESTLNAAKLLGDQSIKGAENNLNNANTQKNALILQMESEKNKLENLLTDVLHKTDTVLGATTKYKTQNDSYELYLSAKNTSYKRTAKSQLLNLYQQKDTIAKLNVSNNISNTELKNNIDTINKTYNDINTLLDTMEKVFINSVAATTFPQTKIDGLMSINNGMQTALQTNFTYFTQFKQQADAALIPDGKGGYTIAGSEAANIGYQSTIASTQQQISSADIGLKAAQANYQAAIENQDNSLGLLSSNITNAELAYQEALKQYEKLNVKAPITGTIGKILVDKGQEIRVGTPLLTIINNSDPIVEVGITANEYNKINSGSTVSIEYMEKILSGKIISISSQAAGNGLYNLIIKLNKKVDIIGDTAKIKISSKTDRLTLPLNIVHPLDGNNAYIYILSGGQPDILNIKIGEVRGDNIEITSDIPTDTQIITNDITNYNPTIHNLIIK